MMKLPHLLDMFLFVQGVVIISEDLQDYLFLVSSLVLSSLLLVLSAFYGSRAPSRVGYPREDLYT